MVTALISFLSVAGVLALLIYSFDRSDGQSPVTEEGLKMFDDIQAEYAIYLAWNDPGEHAYFHEIQKDKVRKAMPLLGRALDRLDT